MEHFDNQQQGNVREKQFYLLHLDTPRIIIVASVIIGLVVISFLMGMNFINDSTGGKKVAAEGTLLDQKGGEKLMLNENIPGPPHSDLDKKPFDDKLVLGGESESEQKKKEKDQPERKDKSSDKIAKADTLSSDEINEIIPPIPEEKKKPKKKHRIVKKKKSKAKKIVQKKRRPSRKIVRKKKRRSRVVEVSDTSRSRYHRRRSGYAIQIASFDTRSKAKKEVRRLQKRKYDAYIENTRVSGKRFYRVRIGTIKNRSKAVRLLNEVQGIHRYRESYMIKE